MLAFSANLTTRADEGWGGEANASEQKGVMQWTGTLLRNVACFQLRSWLAMWFVHQTLPLSLNYGDLICFLALFPRSFVLVRCLREENVAIFSGRFSWRRQTSLSKGFSYYFHDSTTELYFRSPTRQCRCYSKTKRTKYCLKNEGKSHSCHPWQN